jgi:hypothetical protein
MSRKVKDSGFVYIWFDRKHKKFYVGSHWGYPEDRYICSSNWMRNAYKRRPEDFKRRILETVVTTRADLYEREFQWLSQIKEEELGKKYYNLHNRQYITIQYTPEMLEKMASQKNKKQDPDVVAKRAAAIKVTMSTPEKKIELSEQAKAMWAIEGFREAQSERMSDLWKTEEHREKVLPKLTAALNIPEYLEKQSELSKSWWQDPEYRKKQAESHAIAVYSPRSQEARESNSLAQLALWSTDEHRKKMTDAHLNSEAAMAASKENIKKTHTPEAVAKAKEIKRMKLELILSDPIASAEYKKQQKEQARARAMKRWHPMNNQTTEVLN